MSLDRRDFLLWSFQLADILILIFSFGVATLAVKNELGIVSFEQFLAIRVSLENAILFSCLLLAWHIIYSMFGLYYSRRLSSCCTEAIDIIKANTVATGFLYLVSYLFDIILVNPLFLFVFWTVNIFMMIITRFLLRYFLGRIRKYGRNLRNLLIVGTNAHAIGFAEKILGKPELGYEVTGFVDKKWVCSECESFKASYPLIPLQKLDVFLREHVVDEVIICLPIKHYYDIYSRIIDICVEQGIIVRLVADLFFISLAMPG